MLLYLIRHGQTDWNKDHRVMGHGSIALNENGRVAVAALARALKAENIPKVYTSALPRAFESASMLAREWSAELHDESRLNESPFEDWVGKTYADLRGDPQFELYQSVPTRARFSRNEGIAAVQKRALAAVERILEETGTGKAAAVSHSDVIKPVLAHYLGMDLDAMHRLAIANASVTLVDFSGAAPRIRYVNLVPGKWSPCPGVRRGNAPDQ